MAKVISIGECMIELRADLDGRLRQGFAGDAYNTAVYLKRSAPSLDVAFLTVTGDDDFSVAMREAWRKEHIDERHAFKIANMKPALYLIETDAGGNRKFHYWRAESPARQWFQKLASQNATILADADLIYLSGISLAILPPQDQKKAITLLAGLTNRVAFDPNIRPALWPSLDVARACFEAMAASASILLPSRQDVEMLYGIADAHDQIQKLCTLTEAEIALTADADGCLLCSGGVITTIPAIAPIAVVDTSGAGDSFNGAYLAARLLDCPVEEAARQGLALAADVIAEPGAIIFRNAAGPGAKVIPQGALK